MPAPEVLKTVQLVVTMELLAISSIFEVRSELKVCFVTKFVFFFHRVDLVAIFLRIENLEGHQNCIFGLKVTMI